MDNQNRRADDKRAPGTVEWDESSKPATSAPAPVSPTDLHDAIMRLPCNPPGGRGAIQYNGYVAGHRDARHGAAELAASFEVAPAVADSPSTASDELHIGVSNNGQGVHINIMQRHADGTATVIYTAKAPAGDSYGRAALARRACTSGAPADKPELSGASLDDVVDNLREYASNPGYSHNDYADVMRQAAHTIESLRSMFWNYSAAVHDAAAPSAAISNREAHTLRRLIECAEALDKRPRPMCRDCGDEDGTCPNGDKLECDMGKLFADAKRLHDRLASAGAAAKTDHAPMRECPDCDGTQRISPNELCARCDASGIVPDRAAGAGSNQALNALRKAFMTLESSGDEGRTIVLKFNQRADAYAVHDYLLKAGSKEYTAPSVTVQDERAPDGEPGAYDEAVAREAWGVVCRNDRGLTDHAQAAIRDALLAPLWPAGWRAAHPVQDGEKDAVDLHNAIMNIPCDESKANEEYSDRRLAYKHGHRDARHDAAELVFAAQQDAKGEQRGQG